MVPFLKQKTSAAELGIALLQFPSKNSDIGHLVNSIDGSYDRQHVRNELIYLLSFVVDYSTTFALGNKHQEIGAILDVYYSSLQEMDRKGMFNANFYKTLYDNRLPQYTDAVNSDHENGISYTVGRTFAVFCRAPLDITLLMFGSAVFAEHVVLISDFLKSYRIVL